jgi:ABC-2 type transport system ATP-binding protein
MTDYAIEVTGLTKIFNKKAVVDNISLTVNKGAIFGFLGANGSGKTTTIRMICGLLTPCAGEGTCLQYDIRTQSDAIKKHIGYMPQKFSFYAGLTVYENLRFVADIFSVENPKQAIQAIIADLELTKYSNIPAGNLSGGWKQRLALACSLVHKPQLLFLDEPTAGVDPKARREFWDYLHKISLQQGTTVLVTTHYMDEAEKCTSLAYINLGKLLYIGTTKDLIPASHISTFVVTVDRSTQGALITNIARHYPNVLASIVNNDLRISARSRGALNALIAANRDIAFREVTPSFEEVFIGLMND